MQERFLWRRANLILSVLFRRFIARIERKVVMSQSRSYYIPSNTIYDGRLNIHSQYNTRMRTNLHRKVSTSALTVVPSEREVLRSGEVMTNLRNMIGQYNKPGTLPCGTSRAAELRRRRNPSYINSPKKLRLPLNHHYHVYGGNPIR